MLGASATAGRNVTRAPSVVKVPLTASGPFVSTIVRGPTLDGSTASENAIAMAALSGTAIAPSGGLTAATDGGTVSTASANDAEVVLMEIPRAYMSDPYWGLEREIAREEAAIRANPGATRDPVLIGVFGGLSRI